MAKAPWCRGRRLVAAARSRRAYATYACCMITVTTKGIRGLVVFARRAGVEVAPILRAADLSADTLDDADARISRESWATVWKQLSEVLRLPSLAMHVAVGLPFGAFDVLDYIAVTSPTIGESIERVARFFRLIHDQTVLSLASDGTTARLTFDVLDDNVGAGRWSSEFLFACVVLRFRHATAVHWSPTQVCFQHERVGEDPIYEQIFGCPVRFGAPANLLTMPASVLGLRLERADPLLNDVLQRHASALIERLPVVVSLRAGVVRAVQESMLEGEPSIDGIARRMGVSGRTLQRRLKDEGLTFHQLVDDVRCETAVRFLNDPRMAISEIGFLLGFSEPSAFHRAFRRWTGQTPGEFRRERDSLPVG